MGLTSFFGKGRDYIYPLQQMGVTILLSFWLWHRAIKKLVGKDIDLFLQNLTFHIKIVSFHTHIEKKEQQDMETEIGCSYHKPREVGGRGLEDEAGMLRPHFGSITNCVGKYTYMAMQPHQSPKK